MSKVAKLVILILGVLLVLSAFTVILAFNQKKSLEETNKALAEQASKAESRELKLLQEAKKAEEKLQEAQTAKSKFEKDLADVNSQLSDLNKQLTQITSERDDWKARVESLKKERDELMVKLQEKPAPQIVYKEAPSGASPSPTQTVESGQSPSEQDETYWAQVLKEKAGLQVELEEFKSQLSKNAMTTEELKGKASELEMEMSNLKNQRAEMERNIKHTQDLANNLSLELARAKNERKFLNDRIQHFEEENVALRSQIKNLTTTKIALEKSVARLTEEKNAVEKKLIQTENVIQQRVDEIWEIKDHLDRGIEQVKASSKEVELPPIIVKAQGPVVPEKIEDSPGGLVGWEGRVVSVNDENNFVIVNLGEKSGLQIGDALNVYRNAKYVAGLEVIQVRKDIAAADIKDKASPIKVGDTVR